VNSYKIREPQIQLFRHDLLCIEGISRALKVFLGRSAPTTYRTVTTANPEVMIAKNSVKGYRNLYFFRRQLHRCRVRPFVVAAILRGMTFDPKRYDSFIALQDKFHQNIGR
jgi:phenylalanyl-tRNA synthetase beta chain